MDTLHCKVHLKGMTLLENFDSVTRQSKAAISARTGMFVTKS